jgi:glycosyltransferase involved in cell wall biosynthesis
VAIVHDYLTQRGGAERVVLSMLEAFPDAPVYTSLFAPDETYPEFVDVDVRVSQLNRIRPLRTRHRLALPLLARAFSRLEIDADVALCSSSGWAHGASVSGRKIVYCHTPARWLYQSERYVGANRRAVSLALRALRSRLEAWDRAAALTADRYIANSSVVRERVHDVYGIDAEVLHPPPTVDPAGTKDEVSGLAPPFFLCIARLLPYKNVGVIVEAFAELPDERLVIVGTGPLLEALRAKAAPNTTFLESVPDPQLRWLYANCGAVVAASYEDFGLTPVEAAAFGKPSALLRWGGFVDTVVEDRTGVFFDLPEPHQIRDAIRKLNGRQWDADELRTHVARFSEARFVARLREVVADEASRRKP